MNRLHFATRLATLLACCWLAACLPPSRSNAADSGEMTDLASRPGADAAAAPDLAVADVQDGALADAKPAKQDTGAAKPDWVAADATAAPDIGDPPDQEPQTDAADGETFDGAPLSDAPDADLIDAEQFSDADAEAFAADAGPQEYVGPTGPATILFVGNSYTYVNDLPGMFIALLGSTNPPLPWTQDSVVAGGATLQLQATATGAMAKIAQGGWTWVVLQGQSVEPACWPDNFVYWAKILAQQVKAANANLAYFSTWPRKGGSVDYTDPCTGGTPAALFAKLKAGYQQAAQQTGGLRVPVGDAWMQVTETNPEIELYSSDLSHPSAAGTYLTACVFAKVLVGIDPQTATYVPGGVTQEQAVILRKAAAALTP